MWVHNACGDVATRAEAFDARVQARVAAREGLQVAPEGTIVRRFTSRADAKGIGKRGMEYDPDVSKPGIPTASTDIRPANPDWIRDATGARSADAYDAYLDIDVSGMLIRTRTTKAGHIETVVHGSILPELIRAQGRVSRRQVKGGQRGAMEDTAGLHGAIDRLAEGVDTLRPRLLAWADEFDCSQQAVAARLSPDERRLLVQALEGLVLKRILIEPAFAIIARLDANSSKALLLRLYLGRGVSADTKFGGYQFELGLLLSELVEVGGKALLADLVQQPSFDGAKLTDRRVLDSLCDALSLDSVETVQEWLRTVRPLRPETDG